MLPLTWRYWSRTLLTSGEILRAVLTHPSKGFGFRETLPPEVPNWATRPAEERKRLQTSQVVNVRRFRLSDSDMGARIRAFGVEYCDFRTACPDEKFRDAGHLLSNSSYEFTKWFYAEVLKLPVGN